MDALDEYQIIAGERDKLLKVVQTLLGMNVPNLQILVTSPKVSDVEHVHGLLRKVGPFGIRNADADRDIAKYIEVEISRAEVIEQWPYILRKEVEKELGSRAHGM